MRKKLLYIGLLLPTLIGTNQDSAGESEQELSLTQPIVELADDAESDELQEAYEADDEALFDDESLEKDSFGPPEHARGNWFKKQKILKDAHEEYQHVRHEEKIVADLEALFIDKKNSLTNLLEEFNQSLGTTVVSIYTVVVDEIEKLEQNGGSIDSVKGDTSKVGSLTAEERIQATQRHELKSLLLQIKKDLDTVNDLYKALDAAMAVLMQQITASHNFEQKAFDSYEKIAHVLSDQVAKQLYAEILAARENISNIAQYIKGDFSDYVDELSQRCTSSLLIIESQLASLKERGVDLLVAHHTDDQIGEKSLDASHSENKPPHESAAPPKASYRAFTVHLFSRIGDFFVSLWIWLKGFFV